MGWLVRWGIRRDLGQGVTKGGKKGGGREVAMGVARVTASGGWVGVLIRRGGVLPVFCLILYRCLE